MWDDVEENIEKIFLSERIYECLSKLNDRQRSCIYCIFFLGMTIDETANHLKVSSPRIHQIRDRALRIICGRHLLDDFFYLIPHIHPKPEPIEEVPKKVSIFDMHPAFRKANLYAKSLPILNKEKRIREIEKERIAKKEAEEKERIDRVKRQEELYRLSEENIRNFNYAMLMKQKEAEEKFLWNRHNELTNFDRWYEEQMGKKLVPC